MTISVSSETKYLWMDTSLKGSISSESNFISDLLSSRYIDTEPNNLFYIKQVSLKKNQQKKPKANPKAPKKQKTLSNALQLSS